MIRRSAVRRCAVMGMAAWFVALPVAEAAAQVTFGARPVGAVGAYFSSLLGRPQPPSYLAAPGAPTRAAPGSGAPGTAQGLQGGVQAGSAGCTNPVGGRCPDAGELAKRSCVDGIDAATGERCDEMSEEEGQGR